MEKVGYHKREILVDRVKAARDSQEKAKEQFESALDRFRAVINVEGGDLERKYDQLNAELQRNEARAREVHERIAAVEDVSNALFKEWKKELRQYSDPRLRRESERELRETRRHYEEMLAAMKRVEARIDPVLRPFRDQVLFLKHNLNARAIASLQTELGEIQSDVDSLIADLERSIAEADAFIREMGKE
jgi:GH15 family glucan-1,4-alpha-glucosidase